MTDLIKNINDIVSSKNKQNIMNCINIAISYCKSLLIDINKEIKKKININKEYVKSLLCDHMYIVNYYIKFINLLGIIYSDDKFKVAENTINDYLISCFESKIIYEILCVLMKINCNDDDDDDYDTFLNDLITECEKHQKYKKQYQNMKKYIDEINCMIDENENEEIILPKNVKQYFDVDKIIFSDKNYNILQKTISDTKTRKNIENMYTRKNKKYLGIFEKLIVERHEFAKKNKSITYFDYCRSVSDSKEIKGLINFLIEKISYKTQMELLTIYNKMNKNTTNKKIENHDLIYFSNSEIPSHKFSLENILNTVFYITKKYLNISFVLTNDVLGLWESKTTKMYQIKNGKKSLGYVYIDLTGKIMPEPTTIHLQQEYFSNDNIKYETKICLFGGYANDKTKILNYKDALDIFKEIGNIIQMAIYQTKTGNINKNDDFYGLTGKIMDFFFWERETLMKLCDGDSEIVNKIIPIRYINYCYFTKLKCILAHFDLFIHNDANIVEKIKNEGVYDGKCIEDLYDHIHTKFMAAHKSILHMDTEKYVDIPKDVILRETNGDETLIYEDIIVEMFGYGVFEKIKSSESYGKKFIKLLEYRNKNHFKKIILEFVGGGEKCRDMFIEFILDKNVKNTEISSDSSDEKIIVKRKLAI